MPDIKISELTAPIAVTDSDILPAVQSGVTRKITWGALKSTLSGALGRAYLGLGTASTANVTTSAIDTTAGRVMKVGDYGWGGDSPPDTDPDTVAYSGLFQSFNSAAMPSLGTWVGLSMIRDVGGRALQLASEDSTQKLLYRVRLSNSAWQTWRDIWNSAGANAITVDTGSLGYGTGSGGAVTQATSKTTAVTLNKPSGRVTMHNASLAAGATVTFAMLNNKIGASDVIAVTGVSGTGSANYRIDPLWVGAASCNFNVTNITAGALSEALSFNFVVIKGATA